MVDLNIQLPESFFQEEERSGYLVSAKTKELWAIQLDLLNQLDIVCRKNNLKYFLDYGSLLGAIRHKGFIPWDEDIDVGMLREDYDKLMEIGPKEFKYPYFLQNYETDRDCDVSVTRLRRSDTTFLQPIDILYQSSFNLGVFIDIFVYDNVPSNDLIKISRIHDQCMSHFNGAVALAHRDMKRSNVVMSFVMYARYYIYKLRYHSSYNAFKQMDCISRQFEKGDYVSCVFTSTPVLCRQRKWLEDIVYVPFESLMAPIPVAYDDVLKNRYGDYETPVIDTTPKFWFFDTSHSYKELIAQDGFYEQVLKELSINSDDYLIGLMDTIKILKNRVLKLFARS